MKLFSSNDNYNDINELTMMICWAKNPHLLPCIDMDLAEPERAALVSVLENAMQDRFDLCGGGPMYEFMTGMEA